DGRDHKREAGTSSVDENGESNGDAESQDAESASVDQDNSAESHNGEENVIEHGEAGSSEVEAVSSEGETGSVEAEEITVEDETSSSEDDSTSIAASIDADVISEEAPQSEPVTEATSDDNDRGMLEEVH